MKTHKNIGFQIFFSLCCCFSAINTFAQWPQWRGPMRDGISTESTLLKEWPAEGPNLAWSISTIGDGFSSVAIQDQTVYTIGELDSLEILSAIDLKGNLKWQKTIGRASEDKSWPQSRTTPTVCENKVYAISVSGDVACFDGATGNIDWKVPAWEKFGGNVLYGTAELPLVFDDKIIVTPLGKKAAMVALDRFTGKTIWQTEIITDSLNYTSPLLISDKSNRKVIFTSSWNNDFAVDAASGKMLWKGPHTTGAIPIKTEKGIYYPGGFEKFGALYKWDDGNNSMIPVWKDFVISNFMGGAVYFQNKILVPDMSKDIVCLDPENGKTLSRVATTSCCNLIAADNMVYTYEDRVGKVSLFRLVGDNLELVSSFKIKQGNGPCLAHMAIANGLLFVRRGTVLMAYNIKNRTKIQ